MGQAVGCVQGPTQGDHPEFGTEVPAESDPACTADAGASVGDEEAEIAEARDACSGYATQGSRADANPAVFSVATLSQATAAVCFQFVQQHTEIT